MSIYQSVFPNVENTVDVRYCGSGIVLNFSVGDGYSSVHLKNLDHLDDVIATITAARERLAP